MKARAGGSLRRRAVIRVALLAGVLMCCHLDWALAAAPESSATAMPLAARTQFVQATTEPIAAPFPTPQNLPNTLSIDALTAAEIRQLQRDIYAEIKGKEDRRIEGIDGCMQWLFFRTNAAHPWQAFGISMPGKMAGLAKINGALRRTEYIYSITAHSHRTIIGMVHGPGKALGGGHAVVGSFSPKSSYNQWLLDDRADDILSGKFSRGELPSVMATLDFGRTNALTIEGRNVPCSHVEARCRRYFYPVNKMAEWWFSDGQQGLPRLPHEPIPMVDGLTYEMAIEDMCPFSRLGLVEGPINTRAGGAEPGVKKYGINNNASLKAALRPYVQELDR